MALTFYNTLTRKKETFTPREEGKAGLYTCGPTVYDYAHIGNFRAYVFEDLLRRVLRYCGYHVTQVMNLTDVDDKTIRNARAQQTALDDFTSTYKQAFFEDLKTLRIQPAEHYPAATEHIDDMIALVQTLLQKEHAYVGNDGSVYFAIASFPDYGKLSRIDLQGQRSGVRISADEYEKEQVADFALWKAWSEDDGDVAWDSPWGRGRPGWHIECSAMSTRYLGPSFDIHTGGVDNMFPHHDDEIAQSEAANGTAFVKYWLHCEHLTVNNTKMSKSLGNFFTLRDLLDRGFSGRTVRWLLMGTHYRQKLNFAYTPAATKTDDASFDGLEKARQALKRIDEFVARLNDDDARAADAPADDGQQFAEQALTDFRAALEDDLNIAGALAALFELVRAANRAMDHDRLSQTGKTCILDALREMDAVLGVIDVDEHTGGVPAEIVALAEERREARAAKDYQRSDELRDRLSEMGWSIKDGPDGYRLSRR